MKILRDENVEILWEENVKMLREEKYKKYSWRKNVKIFREKITQGGEEEEGGSTGKWERVTMSGCQPSHLNQQSASIVRVCS